MSTTVLKDVGSNATQGNFEDVDYVARAKSIRSLIEVEAADAANACTMSPKVVEALRENDLFWVMVPKLLGGGEASVLTLLQVIEQVARADASSGWALMANSAATIVASYFCSDEHIDRMFSGSRKPVMAATYMPTGKAVLNGSVYSGGGRYSFGSGIAHADWVAGALVVQENGGPQKQADGKPRVVGAFLPKDRIRVNGNWDVVGMQGTGSFDYEIPEQDIPVDWTFNQYWTEPKRGVVVANLGTLATVLAGHTGVVLGIAGRSLEEAARSALQRKRLGSSETIASSPVFRTDFARYEALFQSARALALKVWGDAEASAQAGNPISPLQLQQVRQTATWVHSVAKEIVNYCYGSVSSSLRKPSVLGKCLVDVAVATQHIIVDPSTLVDVAPVLIEKWAEVEAA